MDLRFYQEDGHGNVVDEHGNEPVEMDVDGDGYPLADTVDFDNYMDFKPPEKPKPTPKVPKNFLQLPLDLSSIIRNMQTTLRAFFFTCFMKKA